MQVAKNTHSKYSAYKSTSHFHIHLKRTIKMSIVKGDLWSEQPKLK